MHTAPFFRFSLTLFTALLGIATSALSQTTWSVVPTDVSSNQRAVSAYNQSWPALSTWEAESGGVIFRTAVSGGNLQFSCDKVNLATGGFVNYVTLSVFSDAACTQLVTSGWAYAGSPSVSANAISGQAGTFYGVLSSFNGGGNTYLRHTFPITVVAVPVEPAKTGLQLIGPTGDVLANQTPAKSFTIPVKILRAAPALPLSINGSDAGIAWTFDAAAFTRVGNTFTVKATAPSSTQTISATYTPSGGSQLGGSCTVKVVLPVVTAVAITVPTTALALNATFTPVVKATMSAGPVQTVLASSPRVTWSPDSASAMGNTNGTFTVTSNAVASTNLTATVDGVSKTVPVPIKQAPVTVTELTVTPSTPTLAVGASFTPGLAARLSNNVVTTLTATSSGVTWSFGTLFTRNTATGAFTVKSGTTATSGSITAKYGGKTAVLSVTITRPPTVTGIRIEPIADQPKGAIFTPVAKRVFSDGSTTDITDAAWTSGSTAMVAKPQGQFQVSTTTTATSGTVIAQSGTYKATATVRIVAALPVTKTVTAMKVQVPTTPIAKGASVIPTVELTWSDGTKTTTTLGDPGLSYTVDTTALVRGSSGSLLVLNTTHSNLGKVTVSHTALKTAQTVFIPIAQTITPQKSVLTSHTNGQTLRSTSATFTATEVTAEKVVMRVVTASDTRMGEFTAGLVPTLTLTDLPQNGSKIVISITSYYNGGYEQDQVELKTLVNLAGDIVVRARAMMPLQHVYGAPVPNCIGANAFVLEAAGFGFTTDPMIKTPYSLYQFFENQGKARQRASGEEGYALLAALPHGAVVFFMDPSMNLPWKRPLTSNDRSAIVSRKAYGDVGIWDAIGQELINLSDGTKIGVNNLITKYDHLGQSGANFTSKFVYGWVSAEDFIGSYTTAAAQSYQASAMGEVNFGVLPSPTWQGRYSYANATTSLIPSGTSGNYLIALNDVDTASEVVRYVQTHLFITPTIENGKTVYSSTEGKLYLTSSGGGYLDAYILSYSLGTVWNVSLVPATSVLQLNDGSFSAPLFGGYSFNSQQLSINPSASGVLTYTLNNHILRVNADGSWTIDGTSAVDESLVDEFVGALTDLKQAASQVATEYTQVILNGVIGSLDNLSFDLAVTLDRLLGGDYPGSSGLIQLQEELFNSISQEFAGLGLDRSSMAYFITSNLGFKGVARIARSQALVAFFDRSGKLIASVSELRFNSVARTVAENLKHWGNPKLLAKHFRDHGADFGAASEDEYVRLSQEFLQHARSSHIPAKIDQDGMILIWEEGTNTFAVFNSNMTTATFYKPDPAIHRLPTNLDYWNNQRGTLTTNY